MIASLPMYDRPETAGANDRLWSLIRTALADHGIMAPMVLSRDADLWHTWTRPDLVLSQTCGLPYRSALHGRVTLVATPHYDLACPPGQYYSVIIARRCDMRDHFDGASLAYNEALSQSGWAAALDWARQSKTTFDRLQASGGHRQSAQAVAEGRADLAAIDALTWRMIQRWDAVARDLREVARTTPTPTLPMITALGNDPSPYRQALCQAGAALSERDRDALGLQTYVQIPAEAYLALPVPESAQE